MEILDLIVPFPDLTDCAPLMLKQTSLCPANTLILLKHCKQVFLIYLKIFHVYFSFVKHKSVKVFDIHVMWHVYINYKQQIHRVLKFLIWNINWKNQFVFIRMYINANIVFPFNLAKIFFSHNTPNPIIIKIMSKFFIFLCNFFWMSFYWINIPNMTP